MKSEKGITLVALILIIVLLLVLAAVTVALVLSNETEAPAVEPGTSVVDQTPVVDETVTDENDIVIGWEQIEVIGEDTILVRGECCNRPSPPPHSKNDLLERVIGG